MYAALRSRSLYGLLLTGTLLFALAAGASQAPTTLPHNLDYFTTAGPAGYLNPGVLVGFNPQPDPPGDNSMPNLSNPYAPEFVQPGSGTFTILFGLHDPAGDPVTFDLPTGGPTYNSDLHEYQFAFEGWIEDQGYEAVFDLGGYDGSWQGFNPQPDPPGFGGQFVGFSFESTPLDPMLTVQLFAIDPNGGLTGPYSFTETPEPMSLLLVGSGLAGVLLRRRRK